MYVCFYICYLIKGFIGRIYNQFFSFCEIRSQKGKKMNNFILFYTIFYVTRLFPEPQKFPPSPELPETSQEWNNMAVLF